MLLRCYIGQRLAAYYAQPSDLVVGYGKEINFSRLWGEAHYRRLYRQQYEAQRGQWMTPVELFRPYYSYCFADYIAQDYLSTSDQVVAERIDVVELGAGRGTNADALMTRWKAKFPDLYEKLRYTVVDSSPTLHQLQQKVFGEGIHGDKVEVRLVDLTEVAEGRYVLKSIERCGS